MSATDVATEEVDADPASISLRQSRRRRWLVAAVIAGVVLTSPAWLSLPGRFLVVSDPLVDADAIVILAGDEDARLAYGARLLDEGMTGWFVLTNMRIEVTSPERTYAFLVHRKALRLGVPDDRILVIHDIVATTYEEAVAVRAFALEHELHSLVFVTSPYHTRRARWIISDVFEGTDIQVFIQAVDDHPYSASDWWKSSDGWRWTALEYTKLIAHMLGCKHQGC